jgi:DNA-binding transcriptional ArsR family regulator
MAARSRKSAWALDLRIYERQASICRAFAHPTRLHLLDLLGRGEWACSDLQKRLGVSKTNLSQHIAILKSSGVVLTRREGKRVFCVLAIPEVKQACHIIRNVLRCQIRSSRDLV